LVSPRGAVFEQSVHLEYFCTNNLAEYKAIMLGLQILSSIGVKSVEAFGDSLLVMQQVAGVFQCFNRSLNAYLDKWLEIFALFDDFTLANNLAQQASCFCSNQEKFGFLKKLDIPICQTRQFSFQLMYSATVYSAEPSSAKHDVPVSETGGSEISRVSDEASKIMTVDPDDWRTPLVRYLENHGHITNRKV
jgi:hypothetical protein